MYLYYNLKKIFSEICWDKNFNDLFSLPFLEKKTDIIDNDCALISEFYKAQEKYFAEKGGKKGNEMKWDERTIVMEYQV